MQNYIELQNVSIEIPVFDANRSFRRSLANRLGGEINRNEKKKVYITALHDISFSLKKDDRLGLVSHNGAAKTTLLRLLAHIYRPTKGQYICRGRITSLFSINLAMDMDDTGLENVHTIGMFLGMTKQELKKSNMKLLSLVN